MKPINIGALAAIAILAIGSGWPAGAATRAPRQLPPDAIADYQLGGSYPPPAKVTLVVRDSTASPASGYYNICYINGFQSQPDVAWPSDLLVAGPDGQPLADANWPDEYLLNIATDALRVRIFDRIRGVISRCAQAGFDAVEFDNLDSYTRSNGTLTLDDAIAFARRLVDAAHDEGLAAGQKNTPELSETGRKVIGFDFAVSEQCHRFSECAAYTRVYGSQVIDIEYAGNLRGTFKAVCDDPQTPRNTILRDIKLSPRGGKPYVYEHCASISSRR